MATTKRGTKRGAKGRPAKKTARPPARKVARRAVSTKARTKKAGAKKAATRTATKRAPARAAKTSGGRTSALRRAVGAAAGLSAAAVKRLKTEFMRERAAFEQRLTETVREIGLLRHHELRATALERQVAERDQTIAELRRELEVLKSQPVAAPQQPGLDFGGGATVALDALEETAALDDEDDDLI